MKETLKKYKKKCKVKTITFYKHEADLLKFANSINFQKFVKDCLRCELAISKDVEKEEARVISLDIEDYL